MKTNKKLQQQQKKTSEPLASHLNYRLREGLLIVVAAIALFMLLALLTYNQTNMNHAVLTHSGSHPIKNLGGWVGAMLAWAFFNAFGYMAYVFPFMLAYSAWLFLRSLPEYPGFHAKTFALRAVGFICVIIGGCSMMVLQFTRLHPVVPVGLGGWVGKAAAQSLAAMFNDSGATLILLAIFCCGVTLFTGMSWVGLMDGLGKFTLSIVSNLKTVFLHAVHKINFYRKTRKAERIRKKELKQNAIIANQLKIGIKKTEPVIQRSISASSQNDFQPKIEINAPKTQIKQSQRAQKDKQAPLFYDTPEGELPSLNLLDQPKSSGGKGYSHQQLESMSREVEFRLKDFGIDVQVVAVHPGPVITRFEMQLAPGIKVSRISSLAKDLARSLSVPSVRIVEVIPGKPVVGLELPNEDREMVYLSEILSSQQYEQTRSPLVLALGKDIAGEPIITDLAKMPHLLVAGTTGSGKSVGVNAMLMGLLYKSTPEDVRMILIDPKMLELSIYEGIPHLLTPVVTDMKEAANALRWSVAEMERRYRLLSELGVRNLASYNQKIKNGIKNNEPITDPLWRSETGEPAPNLEILPYVVIVIDEYADMMMVVGKKVEQLIARIAQKARAAGIHLILATQRPSVDVITGLIKANVPSRIAFQVSSKIDSRTVLDQSGAEQLLGHGDMLYLPSGTSVPTRIHGAFVSDDEVHRVVDDWKRRGQPNYLEGILSGGSGGDAGEFSAGFDAESSDKDELYDEAVFIVTKSRKASISNIQRRLKIGYNRAARLIEMMEEQGIVSSMESNGAREVLAPPAPEV